MKHRIERPKQRRARVARERRKRTAAIVAKAKAYSALSSWLRRASRGEWAPASEVIDAARAARSGL